MGRSLSEISRREQRIYLNLPVTLRTGWQGTTVVNGSTVDYSERGLRVRANAPFEVRQDVEVIVSHNPQLSRKYSVMWVRDPIYGRSFYEVGLEVDRDHVV